MSRRGGQMGNGGERGGRGWNRGIEEPPCYRVGQMQPCCQRLALGIVQVKCSYVVQVRTRHLLCIAFHCSALLCIALYCSALLCIALLCVAPPYVQQSHWDAFTDEVQWQKNAMRCKKIKRFVLNPGAISGRDLIESKIHKQKIHLKIIAFIDSEVKKIIVKCRY